MTHTVDYEDQDRRRASAGRDGKTGIVEHGSSGLPDIPKYSVTANEKLLNIFKYASADASQNKDQSALQPLASVFYQNAAQLLPEMLGFTGITAP